LGGLLQNDNRQHADQRAIIYKEIKISLYYCSIVVTDAGKDDL